MALMSNKSHIIILIKQRIPLLSVEYLLLSGKELGYRMYIELAIDDCVYEIEEVEFDQLLAIMRNAQNTLSQEFLTKTDFVQIVFNLYITLNNQHYMINMDKFMVYSSNIYCLNVIKRNLKLQEFLAAKQYNQEVRFYLAYHIACQVYTMLQELLSMSEEGQFVKQKIRENDYYKAHLEKAIYEDRTSSFYVVQKVIIQCINESVSTGRLEQALQLALYRTREQLKEVSRL